MGISRRDCLRGAMAGAGAFTAGLPESVNAQSVRARLLPESRSDFTIKDVRVTPIALPDPPLLASSGCHGPYFLRTIVEIMTSDGVSGIGETGGGERTVAELRQLANKLVGQKATAYRTFPEPPLSVSNRAYAAVEVACLDVLGKATGLRLCELLGGPVRE